MTVNPSSATVKRPVLACSLKCAQSAHSWAAAAAAAPARSEMGETNFRSEMKQPPSFNSCLSVNGAINASSRCGYSACARARPSERSASPPPPPPLGRDRF